MVVDPERSGNHVQAVDRILFDGAETEAQHLAVIRTGLGEFPNQDQWSAVVEYAQTHLSDGPLIDTQLAVAEAIASGKAGSTQKLVARDTYEANTGAVRETIGLVHTVATSPQPLEDGTYKRLFGLVGELQAVKPHEGFDGRKAVDDIRPQSDKAKGKGRIALVGGRLVDGLLYKLDDPKHKYWDGVGRSIEADEALVYARQVSGLAVGIIDRIVHEAEDPAAILGKEAHEAYMDQAAWLQGRHAAYGRQDREAVDAIVDKAVGQVGVDTPDAVQFCLDLHLDTRGVKYSARDAMLDKAVRITQASSREPRTADAKSRLGILARFKTQPSQFESRREELQTYLSNRFNHYLEHRPGFINDVWGLYDTDSGPDVARLLDLIDEYGQMIADRGFSNGHYDPATIQAVPAELARLRSIIPADIPDEAERRIKQRLAGSTPAQ